MFGLFANSPRRIVSAEIIADTDGGWYTWKVTDVALTLRTTGDGESTRQVATFDKPVFVRHVWVLQARASGDPTYGWDSRGEVTCGIPSFGRASYPPMKAQIADGFPHVLATAIPPPYGASCRHPFAEATVVRPVRPVMPPFLAPGSYSSQIEVAVGDQDNLVDAWVFKPSVSEAVNASALAAARASDYQSAVSYCQKADGYYIFRADFSP